MDTLKLLKIVIVLGILIAGIYFASQYYVDNKDEKLKNEICSQINEVFNGKDVVCDGDISGVQVNQDNVSNHAYGEDCSELVYYYKKLSGGFEIVQAKRNNQDIDITTLTSSNMGYKVSNFNYLIPTIDEAYRGAFNYLTSENVATSGYSNGIYQKIMNIPLLSNTYYSLVKTGILNKGTSYIYNGYWKVFYTSYGDRYSVVLDSEKKAKDFREIFGISTLIVLLLSFVFLYNPKGKKKVA